MKLQLLVATINQQDFSKVGEMNIHSEAIFANQSDKHFYAEKVFSFGKIKMITTTTKGVGINRNLALLYADGDYLLFSDDDLCYVSNYENIILEAFKKIPKADAIIFNVKTLYDNLVVKNNKNVKRVRWFNAMSYGAIRIAVKRTSIKRENIMFNLNFGGGADFSSGEDTMFIMDMLKKGLKIYTYPEYIATVDDTLEKSTWFKGYNEKYYYDKGLFFRTLSKKYSKILCLQDLLRHKFYKKSKISFFRAYSIMKLGIKGYEKLKKYEN